MNHLDELNPFQRKAAECTDGPLLIVAGAGAGKTKTLTHRICHLIHEGIAPHNILAITFTNKAAKEMQERIVKLLGSDQKLNLPVGFTESPFVATFHRLGVFILKHDGDRLGIKRHFTIFDRDDSLKAMKKAVVANDLNPKEYEPRKYLSIISRIKGDAVTRLEHEANSSDFFGDELVARIWKEYDRILTDAGALDFDDLLLKTVVLLREHKDVREKYRNTWRYMHIDEYQDTNAVQYELAQLLVGDDEHICVVGDADQTIYGWRGANIKNILQFEKEYPRAEVILLEENYRSTKTIIAAANDVIKKNQFRHEKELFTKNTDGEKISIVSHYSGRDEAHFVAETSSNLIRDGVQPKDIAVLYRANFQSRALEEAFLSLHVPYQVLGTRFFDRKEVKDVIAFLRAARNPENVADIERVINVPPRGIGKVTLAKIVANKKHELSASMQAKVKSFFDMLSEIKKTSEEKKPSEVLQYILSRTTLERHLKEGSEDDQERLENLGELVTLATRYDALSAGEGIEAFLEDAILASEQDSLDHSQKEKQKNAVKLMTVHASKGLEFKYVFIVGLEDELFPHKSMDDHTKRDDEEERRLFYVALTRAKQKLYLTHANMRTIFGSEHFQSPSEFLDDINPLYAERDGVFEGEKEGGATEYLIIE